MMRSSNLSNGKHLETKIQNRLNLFKNVEQPRHIYKCICFAITRKCPLECRRCFFCGSRDGESIDIADAQTIIANLPNDLEVITLSGGEPFANIELLFDILGEIKNRNFPELSQISILTTGIWATNREYVKEVVRELIDLDVNMFAIGAFDKWHYEAGLKKELPELLVKALKEDFGAIEPKWKSNEDILREVYSHNLYVRPMANNTAIPAGRGLWALKDDEKGITLEPHFMCRGFLNTLYGYAYYVNFNGELHFCANFSAKPLGNLKEESFNSILSRSKEDKFLQMIHEGDMVAFAEKYFGLSKEEIERELKDWGREGFCTRLFIEYFKDREDKPIMHRIYEFERSKINQ
ncbi:4Fe-4S cluster-binding domain-containing protein [Candidatus Poribacteria bacterium]|nr:4Fe-4S cluster-binding domain-containing protein [Candidatus Poribacteria bacterium]